MKPYYVSQNVFVEDCGYMFIAQQNIKQKGIVRGTKLLKSFVTKSAAIDYAREFTKRKKSNV